MSVMSLGVRSTFSETAEFSRFIQIQIALSEITRIPQDVSSRPARAFCPPLIITCVFVQHVVEPVYILHYDRHVAVSRAVRFILDGNPEQSLPVTLK